MAAATATLMTAEEFFAWSHRPENRDKHFELERGKVIEVSRPGKLHGLVCANVTRVLGNFTFQRRKGYVCCNDIDIIWEENPDTVRGPDVVMYEKGLPYEHVSRKYDKEIPQLAVEVLSPNDKWGKVMRRVSEFLRRGVPVVWLVDPEDRTVTVHRPDQIPQVLDENDELTGAPAFPDLSCRVADFFFVPEQ